MVGTCTSLFIIILFIFIIILIFFSNSLKIILWAKAEATLQVMNNIGSTLKYFSNNLFQKFQKQRQYPS